MCFVLFCFYFGSLAVKKTISKQNIYEKNRVLQVCFECLKTLFSRKNDNVIVKTLSLPYAVLSVVHTVNKQSKIKQNPKSKKLLTAT